MVRYDHANKEHRMAALQGAITLVLVSFGFGLGLLAGLVLWLR